MKRIIAGFTFGLVGALRVKRDSVGRIVEYVHQLPLAVRPNRHAGGPFCSFDLPEASPLAGVYAFIVGDEVKYIGECEDLQRRFGRLGYGRIAARNCYSDGQATNCKVNGFVLKESKANRSVNVWFLPSADRKLVESQLLSQLAPSWNGTRPTRSGESANSSSSSFSGKSTRTSSFESALQAEFEAAERSGRSSVRIRSGDLHQIVGGYPGRSHQMPTCCKVMKRAMLVGDYVIKSPAKGVGANLVIEYYLPRGPLSNPMR